MRVRRRGASRGRVYSQITPHLPLGSSPTSGRLSVYGKDATNQWNARICDGRAKTSKSFVPLFVAKTISLLKISKSGGRRGKKERFKRKNDDSRQTRRFKDPQTCRKYLKAPLKLWDTKYIL